MSKKYTGILFKFNEPSIYGDIVDKPSFIQCMNSPECQRMMKDKLLIGTLTHKTRDKAEADEEATVNTTDYLLDEGKEALALTKLWVDPDGNTVRYVIEVFEYGLGLRVISALSEGIKLRPSVVFGVADPDSKLMTILRIISLDLTAAPAFNTTMEEYNG